MVLRSNVHECLGIVALGRPPERKLYVIFARRKIESNDGFTV